jgi:hypothetical protein
MACDFGLRKLKINSELDSEGFLYINNTYTPYDVTKTFKLGEITDTNGSIICPGEIVSIMDYEEFESNKENITQYSSVLKGKKIRIYILDDSVMISRECEIYPDQKLMSEDEIKKQINFDLLDKNNCYYATVVNDINNNKQIILTYMTELLNPKLENIDLSHDLAFMNHLPIYTFANNSAMEIFKTELKNQENGLIFYKNNGDRFEFWTPMYSDIKSQERPYNMSPNDYYILLLNKYPLGKTYETFFKDLHYDVDIYLKHYPEDNRIFDLMEQRLNVYANFNADYLSLLSEDSDKIQKIKNLLCIDKDYDLNPEEVVNILIKFKNNCDKGTTV